jgi:uncharacterized protein YcfL
MQKGWPIMNKTLIIACLTSLLLVGCHPGSSDTRVNTATGVKSDTLTNNVITRPIGSFINFFLGPGIEITGVTDRRNASNFLEVQITGVNHATKRKIFDYRVEWLDADGMLVDTPMTTWLPQSVMPGTTFSFKAIAPNPKATDFRVITRPNKNTK